MWPGPSAVPLSTIWSHFGMHTTVNVPVPTFLGTEGVGLATATGAVCGVEAGLAGVGLGEATGGGVAAATVGVLGGATFAELDGRDGGVAAVSTVAAAFDGGAGFIAAGGVTAIAVRNAVRAVMNGS